MKDPIEKFLSIADAQLKVTQVVVKGFRQVVQNEVFAAGLKLAASAVVKTVNDLREEYEEAERELKIAESGLTAEEYAEEEAKEAKAREERNQSHKETMDKFNDVFKTKDS
jgi:NADH:ubiquinone oxidoreductase subunit B-like Fe-S oxidoreductase